MWYAERYPGGKLPALPLSDFSFDLPEELIALRPVRPRRASRMLVVSPNGTLCDESVRNLPQLLRPGDRLVFNNTRVLPCRLSAERFRDTAQGKVSARISITLTGQISGDEWTSLIRPAKRVQVGEVLHIAADFSCEVIEKTGGEARLRFSAAAEALQRQLARHGRMPLPPYIASRREVDTRDNEDYQTCFARHEGAFAAPTAALHFDAELLSEIKERGIEHSFITLHVGAGTFLPVKAGHIDAHRMHPEWGSIAARAAEEINATRRVGGRIIAVGTTSLRLLESAAKPDGSIAAYAGPTDIFIAPGFEFRAADGLMTNFHLPESTLFMLVSAFCEQTTMKSAYMHAISNGYRFYSYGDSSLLWRPA